MRGREGGVTREPATSFGLPARGNGLAWPGLALTGLTLYNPGWGDTMTVLTCWRVTLLPIIYLAPPT